jgi:outer membrane lipoprotein-sorting protein
VSVAPIQSACRAALRPATCIVAGLLLGLPSAVGALGEPTALAQADAAYAKIDDYRMTIAVHETDGGRSEDVIYSVLFKKPTSERVDIVAGPDKGGGVVWLGGDTVKAHHGGIFSRVHFTLNLHSRLVVTLRGDSIDKTTLPAMLAHFRTTPGTLSEAPGPQIDGTETTAITLEAADAASNDGLTREVLDVAASTHFPMRWESYAGATLVKVMDVKAVETNVGLTPGDFPW